MFRYIHLGGAIAASFFAAWEGNKSLRMGSARGGPTPKCAGLVRGPTWCILLGVGVVLTARGSCGYAARRIYFFIKVNLKKVTGA